MLQKLIARYQGRSPMWPAFRKAFMKDNPSCAACNSMKRLQVHHIVPVSLNKDLELETFNCITLCHRCHLTIGHFNDYRFYNRGVVIDAANLLLHRDACIKEMVK